MSYKLMKGFAMKAIFLFLLIIGPVVSYSASGAAAAGAGDDAAIPKPAAVSVVGFDYGFKPEDFQALKGERCYEEDILRYLKRLEALAGSASALDSLFANKEFINLRGHIAHGYICLLEYAYLLKAKFSPITKLNPLSEVITKPQIEKAIDQIYKTMPILKDSNGDVYNYESERWNFDGKVYIGRNPFFAPLTVLLNVLFEPTEALAAVQRIISQAYSILKKRYHYYRFIKPLSTTMVHIHKLSDTAAREEVPPMLQQLKDMIYHDILYRYNLEDENPPVDFPKALKDARQSIPWGLMSTLGAEAHWLLSAGWDIHSTHGVLYEAWPDLKENFRSISLSLQRLLEMEQGYYQSGPLPVAVKPAYGHMKSLADWYVAQTGLAMLRVHIEDVDKDWKHYDELGHVFPESSSLFSAFDVGKWKVEELRKKHTFLKSLKRAYVLHYMLMGGEMAKRLYKIFKDADDDAITMAFGAWKDLRDHIVHTSQKEGVAAFEARLNSVNDADWEELIQGYLALGPVIAGPQDALSSLRWDAIKGMPALRVVFSEDAAVKDLFNRFYTNLFKLNQFIEYGLWQGPEETPRAVFDRSLTTFRNTLKEAHKKNITADLLLDPKVTKREASRKRLGVLEDAQGAMWAELCSLADALKVSGVGTPKESKPKKVILLENLKTLSSYLSRIEQVKETTFSRHLVPVEAMLLEYYLILLRDSGNYVIDHLEEHLDFSSQTPAMLKQLNDTIKLVNYLKALIVSIINPKAHLHRFSEPRFNEMRAEVLHHAMHDNEDVLNLINAFIVALSDGAISGDAAAGAGGAKGGAGGGAGAGVGAFLS